MSISEQYGRSNMDSQCKKHEHEFNKLGYDFFVCHNSDVGYALVAKKFGI